MCIDKQIGMSNVEFMAPRLIIGECSHLFDADDVNPGLSRFASYLVIGCAVLPRLTSLTLWNFSSYVLIMGARGCAVG